MQAIQVQKIEFQSMEIADLKHRNAELNKSYQKCLEEFQSSNKNEEESYKKKMVELVDEHQRAIRFVEQECE